MNIELSSADMCYIVDGSVACGMTREEFTQQLIHAAIGGRRSRLPVDYLQPLKGIKGVETRIGNVPCMAYEDRPLKAVLPDIDLRKRELAASGALMRDTQNFKRVVMIRTRNTRCWVFRADSLE